MSQNVDENEEYEQVNANRNKNTKSSCLINNIGGQNLHEIESQEEESNLLTADTTRNTNICESGNGTVRQGRLFHTFIISKSPFIRS